MTALLALAGVVGILLVPAASGAQTRAERISERLNGRALVAAQVDPGAPAAAALATPTFEFPDIGAILGDVLTRLRPLFSPILNLLEVILNQLSASLCRALGAGFCASP